MIKRLTLLSAALLCCGHGYAQDLTQKAIVRRIVRAFPKTQIVECPVRYAKALRLSQSICLQDPAKSSTQLFNDIRQHFKSNIVSLDGFRFAAWKSGTQLYPIRQYNFLPVVFISVQSGVPTATPPALPGQYHPTKNEAKAAGAIAGVTYARLEDLAPLVQINRQQTGVYLFKNGHTLHLHQREVAATADGQKITLSAAPIGLRSQIYIPVSALRYLSCLLEPAYGEVDSGYLKVTCTKDLHVTSRSIAAWRF